MSKVNISKIINDFSDISFKTYRNVLGKYILFFALPKERMNRYMIIEKTCDYIELVKVNNRTHFNDLLIVFMEDSINLLDGRIEKKSRADKYYQRAKTIKEELKKNKENITITKIEDFSRIFLCLYGAYVKNFKSVSNFSFSINDINFNTIYHAIKNEKKAIIPMIMDKKIYNPEDRYSSFSFSLLMSLIMYLRLADQATEYKVVE